jgi:hypothetical protein
VNAHGEPPVLGAGICLFFGVAGKWRPDPTVTSYNIVIVGLSPIHHPSPSSKKLSVPSVLNPKSAILNHNQKCMRHANISTPSGIGGIPPDMHVSQHETPQRKLNNAKFAAIQWKLDIESTLKPLRTPGPEHERLAAKIYFKSERLHLA